MRFALFILLPPPMLQRPTKRHAKRCSAWNAIPCRQARYDEDVGVTNPPGPPEADCCDRPNRAGRGQPPAICVTPCHGAGSRPRHPDSLARHVPGLAPQSLPDSPRATANCPCYHGLLGLKRLRTLQQRWHVGLVRGDVRGEEARGHSDTTLGSPRTISANPRKVADAEGRRESLSILDEGPVSRRGLRCGMPCGAACGRATRLPTVHAAVWPQQSSTTETRQQENAMGSHRYPPDRVS